jgi:ribose transport system substrate-binding protein
VNSFHRGRSTSGRSRVRFWGAVVTASLLTLTACSGGSADESADEPSSNDADSAVVTDAMGPVTEAQLPTEPFTPPTGKHIVIMPCGGAGAGCPDEAKVEKAVAESLGWTVDVIDGKNDPTVWNQIVKQAVDSGADGIIAVAADPNLYADAMTAVAAKDVPFVLTQQTPFDGDVEGIDTYVAADPPVGGKDAAEWIIADSGGKGHVLLLDIPGYKGLGQRITTIADTLGSDCSDCVVYKEDMTVATLGTSLAPLVTTQLQQHPDIQYIWASDDCCVSFIQQGIQQAGKTDSVKVMSVSGYPDYMTQVKDGKLAFELASPTLGLTSWVAVDSLARVMAGVPTEKFWAMPQRIWTQENIDEAPAEVYEKGWDVEFDYQSQFKKLWGISG